MALMSGNLDICFTNRLAWKGKVRTSLNRWTLADRIAGSRANRHPDAPAVWVRRNWETDPAHAANTNLPPAWVPRRRPRLELIPSRIDCSIQREWRLCGPDMARPVPQEHFTGSLKYRMPPVHFFYKNEKRVHIVLANWLAVHDFWLAKASHDERPTSELGLPASKWWSVLDGKYKVSAEHTQRTAGLQPWTPSPAPAPAAQAASAQEANRTVAHAETTVRVAALQTQMRDLQRRYRYKDDDAPREPDDDDEPPMIDVDPPPRTFYTRLANDDEPPLLLEDQRALVIPADWNSREKEHWFQLDNDRMVYVGKKSRGRTERERIWHYHVDYHKYRFVYFDGVLDVINEHPNAPPGERRLCDGVLRWCRTVDDAVGLASASRSVWRVLSSLKEPEVSDLFLT